MNSNMLFMDNPNMTKDERKKVWRDLEKKYLPHRDYEDNEILERGCWLFKQGHIFKDPFYYIDYVLLKFVHSNSLRKWKKIELVMGRLSKNL